MEMKQTFNFFVAQYRRLTDCCAGSIEAGLTSRAIQSSAANTDLSINNLLSMMYPATPFTNIHSKLSSEGQKACEMSPRKNTDQHPPPLAASYTSLYVKNCPPEADDLWVYERCTSPSLAVNQLDMQLELLEVSPQAINEEDSHKDICKVSSFLPHGNLWRVETDLSFVLIGPGA